MMLNIAHAVVKLPCLKMGINWLAFAFLALANSLQSSA
ncbi:hypothetical protein Lpla01_02644 [Lactiplantibacillus plajomi]